jgi:cation-transporting ATPase 13A2
MASSDEEVHDYTGGASAVEISQALSSGGATFYRSRRDSQVGSAYDDDGGGAIFDGLGSVNIPSSVTSMHHERMISFRSSRSFSRSRDFHTRRMSSNRPSLSGRRSSGDAPTDPLIAGEEVESPEEGDTEPEEGDIGRQSRGSQSRRPRPRYNRDSSSSSSPQASRSVLGNLSSLFMRTPSKLDSEIPRRSSQSRRSSASISSYRRANRRTRSVSSRDGSDYAVESEDEGESWGYHSGEEESLMEDSDIGSFRDDMPGSPLSGMGSRPPSPTSSLPLLTGHADPIFGDTRLDLEDPTTAFDDSSPAPFGPPSRQVIYITDEDIALRFVGFEIIQWKRLLWFLGCIGTAGVLGLIGLWLPRIWLRCVGREKGFKLLKPSSALVVVEVRYQA